MSNERPDEYAGWAGRLEEPGALAGQGLANKEAAWDKLHSRLGNQPRKKRIAGYWLAAACLLLTLIPATLLFRNHRPATTQLAGPARGQTPLAQKPGTPVLPEKAPISTPEITGSRPSGQPATTIPARTTSPGYPVPSPPGGQENLVRSVIISRFVSRSPHPRTHSLTKEALRTPRPPLAVTAPPPPSVAANLPIAPVRPATVKKELTVISINEIANPVEQGPSTAGRHERSGHFRIGFNPGTIRPAVATQDPPKTRLTIKLSSQNP
jgi:hypothetical protein